MGVLEPDRRKGSASFAFSQRSGMIDLVDHERLIVDARQLMRLRQEAMAAEARHDLEMARRHHAAAVACARGELLPGLGDDEWLLRARDRLRLAACASAVRGAELAIAAGRSDDALMLGSRAVELDPYAEDARRTLISALMGSGDRSGARVALKELLTLLSDMGAEPEAATRMLGLRLGAEL
jgi:LuxR family transcriptional regulator, maltose regulon positive regulatory protein